MNLRGDKKIERDKEKLMLCVSRKGWTNIMRKSHLKFTRKKKEINMVKLQMLLIKTMKVLQEKKQQKHKQ